MLQKVPSLQQLCLKRACLLVKAGTWDRCAENPLSSLPVKMVDTLMAFFLSYPTFMRTRDLRLVFQSGKLSKFDLSTLLLDEEKHLLSTWLTEDLCKQLRTLTVLHPLCGESGVSVVSEILQRCHYLEEFNSKLCIDLSALRNCQHLKNLRLKLHSPYGEDFHLKIVDFVQSKPNLEVFSFCSLKDGFSAYQSIAAVLLNCPKIISLGFVDSLEALFHIRKTKGRDKKFNLKRCFWGLSEENVPMHVRLPKTSSYYKNFPGMIQNAVHMCPDVERLVLNVYNEEALEHLIQLKHLKSLSLKYNFKSEDELTTLGFILRNIGPFLEHLSLDTEDTIPVEFIRDYCFNLKTLQISGSVSLTDGVECCVNPLVLEQLHVWVADAKSLIFLLRNSPRLRELYLGKVDCFDDQLMESVSTNSRFPKMTVIGIMQCSLSEIGINRLLNSTCDLKELFFGTLDLYKCTNKLILDNELKVLNYLDTFKLRRREFYFFRPDISF